MGRRFLARGSTRFGRYGFTRNSGSATFSSGSKFIVELNGTTGSLFDQLNVTGGVSIDGANLNVSLGFVPNLGDSFVIINNDATDKVTVTNPFKVGGVPIPEGGTFSVGGGSFRITYAGGTDNNDVVLTRAETNQPPTAQTPNYTGLTSKTITYGASSTIFSGTLAASGNGATGIIGISISGNGITPITQAVALGAGGSFSFTVNTGPINAFSSYTVTYSYAAQGNFNAASDISTAMTVIRASLNVTAELKNKVYGSGDPSLTFQYTGSLFNGDNFSGGLSRAAGESVNSYAISQSTLTAGNNYTITYNTANFTIDLRLLPLAKLTKSINTLTKLTEYISTIDWLKPDGTLDRSINVPTVTSTGAAIDFGTPSVAVVADRNADGFADLFIGSQSGKGNLLGLVSGKTGALLWSTAPYHSRFKGGVNVALGDITGDGVPEVVVGTASNGTPNVRAFQQTGVYNFTMIRNFFAYTTLYTKGVSVAVGDVNKDGTGDIITGTAGSGDNVRVFSGGTSMIADFFAFNRAGAIPGYAGGITVAAGDVNKDGYADIVTGTAIQYSRVRVYSGINSGLLNVVGTVLQDFTTSSKNLGVQVMAADFGDGKVSVGVLTQTDVSVLLNTYGYNGRLAPTSIMSKIYAKPTGTMPTYRFG